MIAVWLCVLDVQMHFNKALHQARLLYVLLEDRSDAKDLACVVVDMLKQQCANMARLRDAPTLEDEVMLDADFIALDPRDATADAGCG